LMTRHYRPNDIRVRSLFSSWLKQCASGIASASGYQRLQAIPHWRSQWHTVN
jgi:hypothetical protein